MRSIGLIGAGLIGAPVVEALSRGEIADCELVGVLRRSVASDAPGIETADPEEFFARGSDVIVEAAGGAAVAAFGQRALEVADLWVSSGAALADVSLRNTLVDVAREHQRELRMLTGALAGLDAITTAAVDPDMTLELVICIGPGTGEREVVFSGTVADAAGRFPEDVNVSVAAAMAGHGPERTQIEVIRPAPDEVRELRYRVTSRFGSFETLSVPVVDPSQGIHVVSANIIAALAGESQPLRVR